MSAFAIYRLPHEDHATMIRQTKGEPVELHSITELNGKQGFVVAPFEVKDDQPVVLIEGEKTHVERFPFCHVERFPFCHVERSRDISRLYADWRSQNISYGDT